MNYLGSCRVFYYLNCLSRKVDIGVDIGIYQKVKVIKNFIGRGLSNNNY